MILVSFCLSAVHLHTNFHYQRANITHFHKPTKHLTKKMKKIWFTPYFIYKNDRFAIKNHSTKNCTIVTYSQYARHVRRVRKGRTSSTQGAYKKVPRHCCLSTNTLPIEGINASFLDVEVFSYVQVCLLLMVYSLWELIDWGSCVIVNCQMILLQSFQIVTCWWAVFREWLLGECLEIKQTCITPPPRVFSLTVVSDTQLVEALFVDELGHFCPCSIKRLCRTYSFIVFMTEAVP